MILQDPAHPNRILDELAALLADPAVERLRVAVAYASLDGVKALHALLAATGDKMDIEIVVSLDMGITRKAALEALLEGCGLVKVITTDSRLGTFHAKAFVVDRGDAAQRAIIGSANLTYAALTRNYEAASAADLSQEGSDSWEQWWSELTHAADGLTTQIVEAYSERRPPPGNRERIADEEVETGSNGLTVALARSEAPASVANWLLIDWGGTGEYRLQFEIPQEPAAFFAPVLDEGRAIALRHEGVEYEDNQLRFYADNGMPRINLDPRIPAVEDGSIKRQATLFTRLGPDRYELDLVDRPERAARLAEAACVGEVGHTNRRDGTHRRFGWSSSASR
ncbi:MAG TPA: phospholipase D family protein [Solirubrobacterales bacterium]|nr:phospholipase D family protein [Solirubrobacterales bacterium]